MLDNKTFQKLGGWAGYRLQKVLLAKAPGRNVGTSPGVDQEMDDL